MLEKNNLFTFIPGSPGRPFIPAVPAHPAYCVTETITERVFTGYQLACLPEFTDEFGQFHARHCFMAGGRFVNRTRKVKTCYAASGGSPAVPAVPATTAQWNIDHNLGWNAGAHSVTRMPGDAYVSFKVPVGSGSLVGFNHVSLSVGFNEIAHGILFHNGVARVYESGTPKGEVLAFHPTDTFIIERVNRNVSYYRQVEDETPVRFYQSLVLSNGSIIVDASMYSGGDRID